MRFCTCVAGTVLGLALATPVTARAQGTSEAAATALFDDGRKLMDQKRYAEACPKLAESERLAPSGGTLINLAECYEHTGQTASAWVAWKDAAARANAAGKADVERRAVSRAAALEPVLARLTVLVDAASDVPGLQVRRDGVDVGHAEFGVALPVDPGAHVIEAIAPRRQPFSAKVDVATKQTDARVVVSLAEDPKAVVPPAAPAPAVAPPSLTPASATAEQPPPAGASTQKTIALVVGGVGVAGLVVGTIFGLDAKSKNDQALQSCRTSTLCSPAGLSLTDDAKSAATISTIAFVAGGAAVAAGLVVWLTAPSSRATTSAMRLTPVVARSFTGLALDRAW